jgi:ketose-bisphosphate aldolase
VGLNEILPQDRKNKTATGAFMVWSFDSIYAVVDTAQKMGRPALMVVGEYEAKSYMGGFDTVRKMAECVVKDYDIPTVLHADHFRSYDSIVEAIGAGFTSVMIDASSLPFDQNVATTARVVEFAHKFGISVEGEIGRISGNEGDDTTIDCETFQTDPEEAAHFVEQTGVDALAVSIGTVHGAYTSVPKINIARLGLIAEQVSLPLVLHGGSGTPDEEIVRVIHHGIAKINVATDLLTVSAQSITDLQKAAGFRYSVGNLFLPARKALQKLLEYKMELFLARPNECEAV